jgi:general secretion pathway protein A
VLNPFLSEEDLLKRVLQDFGVVSREDVKRGALSRVTKQELVDALYDFLLGLVPIDAGAVLIIDEAQNLPFSVLEQIRILSNLETDKEKLLQIILVGQLNLKTMLHRPELRQLDQRVSIRYELEPLDRDGVAAYVAHRLTIAGGSAAVTFTAKALERVHQFSGGIPRLINLICDRALLAGFTEQTRRITPELVEHAAESLDVQPVGQSPLRWLVQRAAMFASAAVVLVACVFAVAATAFVYERFSGAAVRLQRDARPIDAARASVRAASDRRLPADAALTILVASYPLSRDESAADVRSMTAWLEAAGFSVYYTQVDFGSRGRWQRVLAGAYTDRQTAQADVDRLRRAAPGVDARLVSAQFAAGTVASLAPDAEIAIRRAGLE